MAHYHDNANSFPMATTVAYSDPGVQTTWGTWSCQALMLNYLEGGSLYNAANFSWNCWYDVGYNVNSTVFNARVSNFICPSDGKSGPGSNNINNYMASMGCATNPWTLTGSGVFSNYASYGYNSLTDGSSRTVAFSEALVSDYSLHSVAWRDGVAAGVGSQGEADNGPGMNKPGVMADLATCNQLWNAKSNIPGSEDKGYRWASGSPGVAVFNTIVPPNSEQFKWAGCRLDCAGCGFEFGQYENATSNHSGGVNVLFCDGGVRFVMSSVAINIWWAIGTRNGSEIIPKDS